MAMLRQLVRRLAVTSLHRFLRLRSAPLPGALRANGLLVVAPHPDDESLGCGRMIASSRLRDIPIHVVWLTDGEASHPDFPTGAPGLAKVRRAEARAAARILGIPDSCLHFLGAPDGQLPHLAAERRASLIAGLSGLIDSLQPSSVLVTSELDGSTEHSAAHAFTREAIAISKHRPNLISYLVWAHWQVRGLIALCRNNSALYFARSEPETERLHAQAILAHASQVTPQSPSGETSLSPQFLACFPRGGEFFLKG